MTTKLLKVPFLYEVLLLESSSAGTHQIYVIKDTVDVSVPDVPLEHVPIAFIKDGTTPYRWDGCRLYRPYMTEEASWFSLDAFNHHVSNSIESLPTNPFYAVWRGIGTELLENATFNDTEITPLPADQVPFLVGRGEVFSNKEFVVSAILDRARSLRVIDGCLWFQTPEPIYECATSVGKDGGTQVLLLSTDHDESASMAHG